MPRHYALLIGAAYEGLRIHCGKKVLYVRDQVCYNVTTRQIEPERGTESDA